MQFTLNDAGREACMGVAPATHQVIVDEDLPVAVEMIAALAHMPHLGTEHAGLSHPVLCCLQPFLDARQVPTEAGIRPRESA